MDLQRTVSKLPLSTASLTIERLLAALAAGTVGDLLARELQLPKPAAVTVMTPQRTSGVCEVTR